MTRFHRTRLWLAALASAPLVSVAVATSAQGALVVSGEPTRNVTCSAGICRATARFAAMNAGELADMLGSSDVTLESREVAKDIKLKIAFSWTSASRLTLLSRHSIAVDKPVTVAGPGGLTLIINHGDQGGPSLLRATAASPSGI